MYSRLGRGLVNAAACFGAVAGCGPRTLASLGGDGIFYRATERFVQELRLVSNTDGPLQWTVGAYYKDDESQGTRHSACHKGGYRSTTALIPTVPCNTRSTTMSPLRFNGTLCFG